MITKEYAMAYTEVIEILKYVPDEDVQKIPKEKLWINPDCGLKTRGLPETKASLINMVKATKLIKDAYTS